VLHCITRPPLKIITFLWPFVFINVISLGYLESEKSVTQWHAICPVVARVCKNRIEGIVKHCGQEAMIRIDDENKLKNYIVSTRRRLLVNFWADWSIQCRNMYFVMSNISARLDSEDAIVYIDWYHQRQLAKKMEIHGVPTLITYFGGREVARYYGLVSEKALLRYINDS
jgi:thioredoxin 1